MKTAEYIKAVKGLGLSVYEECTNTVMVENDAADTAVVHVDTKRMYGLDTNFTGFIELDEAARGKVFALAVEYSTTPLKERKEEKRYRLRLNAPVIKLSGKDYLNLNKTIGDYFLDDKKENNLFQTTFTGTELSKIDETGFTRIPVEEEEK